MSKNAHENTTNFHWCKGVVPPSEAVGFKWLRIEKEIPVPHADGIGIKWEAGKNGNSEFLNLNVI